MNYFFADGDVQKGPFPLEALRDQGLKPDSLVWREGMANWQQADSVPELASVLSAPNPQPAAPSNPAPQAYPMPGIPSAAPGGTAVGNPYANPPVSLTYQQPYYGGSYGQGYGPQPPSNGMAIASMILGILSIPMMFAYCMGTPCAILAIVFGHITRGRARRGEAAGEGMALAGLICGYVSILLVGVCILIFAIFFGAMVASGH